MAVAAPVSTEGSAGVRIHRSAEVSPSATIGPRTQIWNEAQVCAGASIGGNGVVGKGVYVGRGVIVGHNVKLENRVSVFEGAVLGDGVFIGPHSCLLNDKRPRSITRDGKLKQADDWTSSGVRVDDGASVGGGCTVLPGVHIGRFAMVGAGAVVTKDVPPHVLVYGNPARAFGFVCECGERLDDEGACGQCGARHDIGALA